MSIEHRKKKRFSIKASALAKAISVIQYFLFWNLQNYTYQITYFAHEIHKDKRQYSKNKLMLKCTIPLGWTNLVRY